MKEKLKYHCPECGLDTDVRILFEEVTVGITISEMRSDGTMQYGSPELIFGEPTAYVCALCGHRLPVTPEGDDDSNLILFLTNNQ